MTSEDANLRVFSSPEVVQLYANYNFLQSVERYAFEKYVPKGAAILDIGVGAGRTTPYLAAKASRYVGVDYAKAMIDTCARRFPEYTFRCADATRLTGFVDASFDVVVFSFNGIDYIPTREGRLLCFSEIFRVLMPDGLFIFSSHNSKMLVNLPRFDNAGTIRSIWRFAHAAIKSLPFTRPLLSSGVFRAGAGYYPDPWHGGTKCYCSTPELVELDVCASGFQLLEVMHDHHPRKVPRYFVPSYYYAFVKPQRRESEIIRSNRTDDWSGPSSADHPS